MVFTRAVTAFVAYRHYRSHLAQLFFLQNDFRCLDTSEQLNRSGLPIELPAKVENPAATTAASAEYFFVARYKYTKRRDNGLKNISRNLPSTVAYYFIIARSSRNNFTPWISLRFSFISDCRAKRKSVLLDLRRKRRNNIRFVL